LRQWLYRILRKKKKIVELFAYVCERSSMFQGVPD
jgi:hypothetical protein